MMSSEKFLHNSGIGRIFGAEEAEEEVAEDDDDVEPERSNIRSSTSEANLKEKSDQVKFY